MIHNNKTHKHQLGRLAGRGSSVDHLTPEGELSCLDVECVMKECSKCREGKILSEFYRDPVNPDGHKSICKSCWRLLSKLYRHENKDRLREYDRIRRVENRMAIKASAKLRKKVELGHMKRGPCAICGKPNAHGHHEDYSKPLDVIWLCQSHHSKLHAGTLEIL